MGNSFFNVSVFFINESAYIYSEVILMIYPYGNDYIKYLNDEGSYGITYEQWKNKKGKTYSDKCSQCGNGKDRYQPCPKCKY